MGTKRLNQVVAIERETKQKGYKDISKEHILLQKPEVVGGLQRTYAPKNEDGERFPPESKHVQERVSVALNMVHARLRDYFDLVFTKESGNQKTTADIEVDGQVLVSGVPVATLLFLEKQLEDLHTLFEKLPTLDAAEQWHHDAALDLYVTEPSQTVKTKKTKAVIVRYPATKEHPAQTDLVDEDVIVGTWTQVKQSGAIPDDRRRELVRRVEMLQRAVKQAREKANMIEVEERTMADNIFRYLLA